MNRSQSQPFGHILLKGGRRHALPSSPYVDALPIEVRQALYLEEFDRLAKQSGDTSSVETSKAQH